MSKHVEFIQEEKHLTAVVATRTRSRLGEIRFYRNWNRFTFHPRGGTLYDHECLRDIANACDERTKLHRVSGV